MLPTVQKFLTQIIDYAGMFPPAKLPMDEALANYRQIRDASPHAWMLGRFVCPVARLADAAGDSQLPIAALGQQCTDQQHFLAQLDGDLQAIEAFRRRAGEDAIDSVEVPLPRDMLGNAIGNLLPAVKERFAQANLRGYLEVPMTAAWQDGIDLLTDRLRALTSDAGVVGLKLRCGGVAREAFPSDAQVARFIVRCRDADLPWKATAGLHHPRRHFDGGLDLWHHGFLNVFGAGILADACSLTEANILDMLADRTGESFHFSADCFRWKDWSASLAQIVDLRARRAASFGSCSFAEPCDDLMAMGLLV